LPAKSATAVKSRVGSIVVVAVIIVNLPRLS
jgi:hypothetical protein